MYTHDDCMCKSKEYARAYILPQKYENLFSCKEGFLAGTIFKDLYRPYHDHKHEIAYNMNMTAKKVNVRGDILCVRVKIS